jgi:hypothetical protein
MMAVGCWATSNDSKAAVIEIYFRVFFILLFVMEPDFSAGGWLPGNVTTQNLPTSGSVL